MSPPRQSQAIKLDLDRLISALIGKGIADDQNFPKLCRYSGNVWEVSFEGAEHVSFSMSDIDYDDIYKELLNKRSYNAKLIDGGLLQLQYRFEGDELVKHRLAYYPSPMLRSFQDDPEAYLRDELFVDIVSRRIVPFPMRFDYDKKAAKDIVHPHCHLTLGDVKGCRIPTTSPLTPRSFTEFILRNFYQTERHDFVSSLPKHQVQLESTITDNERRLIHINIPAL